MSTYTCTNCGELFVRNHSGSRNSKKMFCSMSCYGNWQRGRSFAQQDKPYRPTRTCSSVGCNGKHFGRGFCKKHYSQIFEPKNKWINREHNHVCKHCGSSFYSERKEAKYCSMKCSGAGRKSPFILKKGYKKILAPWHHRADKKGYAFEHIIILESLIGRRLADNEEVHHINRNRADNAPENLMVCSTHAEHMRMHKRSVNASHHVQVSNDSHQQA